MVTKEDIEGFLDRLTVEGGSHKEVQPGLWVVKPGGPLDFDVVVHHSPPVVVLRVKVMDLPKDTNKLAELSRRLLELNASDMVHGSYGIEQNAIVITEALELAHLDFEEFLSAYESMTLAIASHLREIGSFGKSKSNSRGSAKPAAAAPAKKSAAPAKASVTSRAGGNKGRGGRSGGGR